jgi:lipid-binding SYLF domain-containing protein
VASDFSFTHLTHEEARMKAARVLLAVAALSSFTGIVGCESPTPETPAEREMMQSDAQAALERMYSNDPSLRSVVESSYAYAIFPKVGKAGLIAGGAGGRGEVYRNGRLVGYASLSQASVGAQIGAQNFDELIVFKDPAAFDKFKTNEYTPAANATAVAVKSGAGAGTDFKSGTATFVLPTSGAMAEASIGGQHYEFQPLTNEQRNNE